MWANYIETGNPVLTAQDAEKQKKPFKALSSDQMRLVVRLRELAEHEGDWKPTSTRR